MARLTQENRLMSISDFALGTDTLLLTAFHGQESLSDLFEFNIDVLSEDLNISPDAIVGKQATVAIHNDHSRYFNGFIKRFSFGEIKHDNLRSYRLTMVPWLWFLTQTNNHRIFQEKTVKDIVSQIFNDHGFSDFEFNADSGVPREYCIQHNESDFHFISRLLQEDGITYYFKHEQDKHTLYLVDQKNAYEECIETNLEYTKGTQPNSQITQWEHGYTFKKGQWTLNDYHFKEPNKSLIGNTKTTSQYANNAQYEHYEYPGYYQPHHRYDVIAMRQDAEEVDRNTVHGCSDCSTFYAGGRFKLDKHTTKSEKGDYILVSVVHSASDSSYFSGETGESKYENSFDCISADIQHRPKRTLQRPVMKGPQSAVVVGPAGEEIYIDEYGRIKVQFIWDREGQMNESSSCWIRVMQTWAGNKWGASFIPRIGHEVIVEFLDGDPDRPLVVGTVYNEKNKPPYDSKTQSGIKSRSTKGASSSNYNEIRFEDKLGAEELFVQAEKDYTVNIKNNSGSTVGANASQSVGGNDSLNIAGDRSASVGGGETLSVGADQSLSVGANQSTTTGANLSTSVGGAMKIDVSSAHSLSVGGMATENIAAIKALTVGAAYQVSVGAAKNETVGLSSTEQVGIMKNISAGSSITLSCGAASIKLESSGKITIKGTELDCDAGGQCTIKAGRTDIK